MEQPPGDRRAAEHADDGRAGRLAEDREVVRVAAERRDVVLHPGEGGNGVEERLVAGRFAARLLGEFRVREEAECAEAIVEVDEHHALLRQVLAVVVRAVAASLGVGAAVDPDHDRPPLVRAVGVRPDVQEQAVLAGLRRIGKVGGDIDRPPLRRGPLQAGAGELLRLADPVPPDDRLRRAPAEIAHGWCSKRDALEGAHTRGKRDAGDLAAVDPDRILDRRVRRRGRRQHHRGRECKRNSVHVRRDAVKIDVTVI